MRSFCTPDGAMYTLSLDGDASVVGMRAKNED
jgi:hypothetical protein